MQRRKCLLCREIRKTIPSLPSAELSSPRELGYNACWDLNITYANHTQRRAKVPPIIRLLPGLGAPATQESNTPATNSMTSEDTMAEE
jgi:hypothetical protein